MLRSRRCSARHGDLHADAGAGAHAHIAVLDRFAVAADRHLRRSGRGALVLDAKGNGLRLPDDAEARGGREHDTAVALVLVAGDQAMHRRGETERCGLARDVMHPPIGDEQSAGHAVMRDVGQRRGQRREQPRTVGFAVRLAGFDKAHFDARHASEPFGQRRAHRLGLLLTVAEFLARALVDHDDRNRGQGVAVFPRDRRIGEREHEQCERDGAHQCAAGAAEHDQQRNRERNDNRPPHDIGGNERRK